MFRRASANALTAVLCLFTTPAAANDPVARPDLAVRVYDYASIKPGLLTQAQTLVSRAYRNIGVEVQWKTPVRMATTAPDYPSDAEPGDLIVIVLNERMARRSGLAFEAMGAAVVSSDGRGRVAYVLFERLLRAADLAGTSDADMLALVVAHELGHLLLPVGSHSPSGVMRGQWKFDQLRLDRDRFAFTPMQAETIRERVRGGH